MSLFDKYQCENDKGKILKTEVSEVLRKGYRA